MQRLMRVLVFVSVAVLLTGCGKGCKGGKPEDSGESGGDSKPKKAQYILKELASKTLEPSGQEQTVSYKDEVRVVLPGGTLKAKESVSISSIENAPPTNMKHLAELSCFDVSVGKTRVFEKPVTLEFAYDPEKVKGELPPEDGLLAGYWDEDAQVWRVMPVVVDTEKKVARVQTMHLCPWRLYYVAKGYTVRYSDHFKIVYDAKATVTVTVPHPRKPGEMMPQQQAGDEFAQRVVSYLEHAYEQYSTKGYKMPFWGQIEGSIYNTGMRIWVFVNIEDQLVRKASTQTSYRSGFSGAIYMADNFDSMDSVRYETAHELFHCVQNEYMNIASLGRRMWWAEATADYAAVRIAWNLPGTLMGEDIGFKYIEESLTHVGQPGTPHQLHEYKTSHLVDWMVRNGADFKAMWEATMDCPVPLTVLVPLDAYLTKATHKGLASHYTDFAAWLLFDPSGPIAGGDNELFDNGTNQKNEMRLPDKSLPPWKAELKTDLTAKLWGIRPQVSKETMTRMLRVELAEASGAGLKVQVFLLKSGKRAAQKPLASLFDKGDSASVTVGDGDVLYVLAVNTSQINEHKATVKVSDDTVALTVSPAKLEGDDPTKVYKFTAKAENMSSAVKKVEVEWDMGDGSAPIAQTYDNAGGKINDEVIHKFFKDAPTKVVVRVFDRTKAVRQILAEAVVPVTFKKGKDERKLEVRRDFYDDKKPREEYTFYWRRTDTSDPSAKEEVKHGKYKWWHDNGQLAQEADYVDGKKEGSDKRWHPNGQLSFEVNCKNDLFEGSYTDFAQNGHKMSKGNHVNGFSEGTWKYWYYEGPEDGHVALEGNVVRGQRDGAWIHWRLLRTNPDGKKVWRKAEITYENGEKKSEKVLGEIEE
jgi:antitoxin component YwqK of YwqJK toxin-antitoxin module